MRFVAMTVAMVLLAGCKDKAAKPSATNKNRGGDAAVLPALTLNAPHVTGPGVEPPKPLSTTIYYSTTQLSVGDELPVELGTDGLIQAELMEHVLRSLEDKVRSEQPIGIALDGSLTYVRVATFLGRLKRAGLRNIVLLTRERGQIPITLPDPKELGTLRMYVNVASNYITLYSLSGEEGTAAAPKLSVPLAEGTKKLTNALSEIVSRRWSTGTRPPGDLTITLQLEQTDTATLLLRMIAAVRADGSRALFPSVFLTGAS
jgi:biopolymer transport protein ExbD